MANEAQNVGIKNSWSLISFAAGKRLQMGSFVDKSTGETFKSLIFTNSDDSRTFVSFSSKMGELSAQQIAAQKHDLQVVELESGTYKLCKQGDSAWEDIIL